MGERGVSLGWGLRGVGEAQGGGDVPEEANGERRCCPEGAEHDSRFVDDDDASLVDS